MFDFIAVRGTVMSSKWKKEKADILVPSHFHGLLLLIKDSQPLHKPQAENVPYQIIHRFMVRRAKVS